MASFLYPSPFVPYYLSTVPLRVTNPDQNPVVESSSAVEDLATQISTNTFLETLIEAPESAENGKYDNPEVSFCSHSSIFQILFSYRPLGYLLECCYFWVESPDHERQASTDTLGQANDANQQCVSLLPVLALRLGSIS